MSLKHTEVKEEVSMRRIIDIHTHVFSLDPARTGCTLSKAFERATSLIRLKKRGEYLAKGEAFY